MIDQTDIIKMSHITTIELLQERLGIEPIFDELWAMNLHELEELRDSLIPHYNAMVKKRKKKKINQTAYEGKQ